MDRPTSWSTLTLDTTEQPIVDPAIYDQTRVYLQAKQEQDRLREHRLQKWTNRDSDDDSDIAHDDVDEQMSIDAEFGPDFKEPAIKR